MDNGFAFWNAWHAFETIFNRLQLCGDATSNMQCKKSQLILTIYQKRNNNQNQSFHNSCYLSNGLLMCHALVAQFLCQFFIHYYYFFHMNGSIRLFSSKLFSMTIFRFQLQIYCSNILLINIIQYQMIKLSVAKQILQKSNHCTQFLWTKTFANV